MKHKINIKISLLIVFMLTGFGMNLRAQDAGASVKGKVVDEFGKPIAGVLIKSENGKTEFITDINGAYVLPIKDNSEFITFYSVGYKNEVVKLTGEDVVNVSMKTDADRKDEIVDLGYTKQSRNSVTGAVSSVSGEQLAKSPVANLSQALSGQLSGLTSLEYNSELSRSGVYNLIRGFSSINGYDPVVVIDGVICPNTNYEYITPKEIETVTILKDASSTALYGIQGGNGIISITTKRGHTGKVNVGVWFDQSFQQMTRRPEFVNSADYAELRNQAGYNDGLGTYSQFDQHDVDMYRSGENRELYPDNNYYDMFMKSYSSMQRVGVDVSGGTNAIRYYSNVNFMHQGLPFKTDPAQTKYDPSPKNNWINYRTNVDLRINKYLDAFVRLSGNIKNERIAGEENSTIYSRLFNLPPTMYGPTTPIIEDPEDPTKTTGGQVITHEREDYPVYGLLNRSGYQNAVVTNIISQAGLTLDMSFLTKGLSLTGLMSYQTNSVNGTTTRQDFERWMRTGDKDELKFEKKGSQLNTSLKYGKWSNFYYNLNFFANANYSRTFGKHSVDAMAYVFYLQQDKESWYDGAGMLNYKRQSLGATATYGYDNRLFLKADIGYTGSDQFAKDYRFIATPAVSAAWVISNENFMSDVKWISNLKLRASYGKTANDNLNTAQRFLYLDDIREGNGFQGLLGNPMLHAETVKKQNYGIDLGLFNSLSISFDYFRERSDDMIIGGGNIIPEYQGVPVGYYPKTNAGIMTNNGFEISLNYFKQINKDFSVFAGFNFSSVNNTVVFNGEAELSGDYAYKYRETGYTRGQEFGYLIDYSNGNGYFNSQEELDNSGLTYSFGEARPGDFIYRDLNDDGVIDEKDKAPIGNGWLPKHFYGFSAGLSYKGLDFSFRFQGAHKANVTTGGVGFYENSYEGVFNDIHMNAWTAERYASGAKISYPALSLGESTSHQTNDYFVMDRSYLRLKNVEIGYTLPLKISKAIAAQKIRFTLQGQNLFTIDNMPTKYVDPETGVLNRVQPYRIYSIGVNLTF